MLNPVPAHLRESLLTGSDRDTYQQAVTSREPDDDVARDDLAWWLALQERLEIRAELIRAGLL